jgi:hypothetical protein
MGNIFIKRIDEMERAWQNPSWRILWITLPLIIGSSCLIYKWKADQSIAERQQTALATIVKHDAANHNSYIYTFIAGEKSYSGYDSPSKSEMQIGQQIMVYYDPINPGKNAFVDFKEQSYEDLGSVPMFTIPIMIVALLIFFRRRAARKNCTTRSL